MEGAGKKRKRVVLTIKAKIDIRNILEHSKKIGIEYNILISGQM
jgi:hypothetical protein